MTFLRAIPFSFNILWRLALVFPFMTIALIMLGIVAGFLVFVTAFIAPLVSILLIGFFAVGASVLPTMVGTRLGLRARGASVRNSAAGLVLPAVGYGLFEALCVLLIVALSSVVYVLATPLTWQDLGQLIEMDEDVLLQQLMSVSPVITLIIFAVGGLFVVSLRAALLTPFAGASIGADPSGRAHTPFYGFGSAFWSLLPLTILSYVLWGLAVPLVTLICFMLGFGEALAMAASQVETMEGAELLDLLGLETGVFLALLIVFYLWAFSLQCAGGALAFLNHLARENDAQNAFDMSMDAHLAAASQTSPRVQKEMQSADVMELVRSRMRQNKRD
ncbi:hypothetical protein [Yoonia sp.]|uniref:hypothetical protein n=1 Tax=Yoonia sp. TaxID=2212373 RepID=UPI002E024614|nr:hypothetical protein [Yoonia sp.]